jgi:hypothetical protein
MRKFALEVIALAAVAACGAISFAEATSRVPTSARPITVDRANGSLGSGRIARFVARRSQGAWYVGSTSAGTRVDFRLSPSGQWVRDVHFGSPALPCANHSGSTFVLGDGNFPLVGLRVSDGRFHGVFSSEESTPDNPYGGVGATVSGRFIDQRHVTGTATTQDRACDRTEALTFTATRVRSLPARPTRGQRYVGQTGDGTVGFVVSRLGRHVTAFRFTGVGFLCEPTTGVSTVTMTHSYPAAGLAQNRGGVFTGTLSSRLTESGRPAGTRVRVSVLFLSSREATGTAHLLAGGRRFGKRCTAYATLPWRAVLTH